MAIDLKKKVGPLPVWAWAGIGGAGLLLYMHYRNQQSGTSSAGPTTGAVDPNSVDPSSPFGLTYAQEQSGVIDPTTGLPYAQEASGAGGTGATIATGSTGSSVPSLAQELNDVEGAFPGIASYLGGGGSPTTDTVNPGPTVFTIPPGTTVYNASNGQVVTVPPVAAAAAPAPSAAPAGVPLSPYVPASSQPVPVSPPPAPAPQPMIAAGLPPTAVLFGLNPAPPPARPSRPLSPSLIVHHGLR